MSIPSGMKQVVDNNLKGEKSKLIEIQRKGLTNVAGRDF